MNQKEEKRAGIFFKEFFYFDIVHTKEKKNCILTHFYSTIYNSVLFSHALSLIIPGWMVSTSIFAIFSF